MSAASDRRVGRISMVSPTRRVFHGRPNFLNDAPPTVGSPCVSTGIRMSVPPTSPTPPAATSAVGPASPSPAPTLVQRLRNAGCVYAEEEAQLLAAQARSADDLEAMVARRVAG